MIKIVEQTECKDVDDVKEFCVMTIQAGYEGIVCKNVNSRCPVGLRPCHWITVKPQKI